MTALDVTTPAGNPERRIARAGDEPVPAARALLHEIEDLRAELVRIETDGLARIGAVHPSWCASAANLLHYVALRRHDLRELQDRLAETGLSSLGRSESHVLAHLDHVTRALCRLAGAPPVCERADSAGPAYSDGPRLLREHTEALLGPAPSRRGVRVMVTLPSDSAEDRALVRELVANGMDCARINCAHDDPDAWARMIENLRRAERETSTRCRVLMDLAGPKLRTGAAEPGPPVRKWKPQRDVLGRVSAPARVWLHPAGSAVPAPVEATSCLPVDALWLANLREGDLVSLTDTRGARRSLRAGPRVSGGAWAETSQTAYVTPGTRLRIERRDAEPRDGLVGGFEPAPVEILVRPGDALVLTRPGVAGHPAVRDGSGAVVMPATIPCTLPQVFADVRPGERVFLDDGKVGAVVREATPDRVVLEVTQARARGERIASDKGINLPDTDIDLPALTQKDLDDLTFAARHADAVSLSFVRDPRDVHLLCRRLAELGDAPGIVLKIETRQGFERLPELLLAAMSGPPVGVMIARGDLAVECGWERLAEVQEEILWFCEAAHVPAIWATQVLEGLAKDGRPTRAEITDAAMGERAECVMLNKGPHVVEAVRTLDDILVRMTAHQRKKQAMLRPLRLARDFGARS